VAPSAPPAVTPLPPLSRPPAQWPLPPPTKISAYTNHYDGDNPLAIRASANRSDNYFLIIGDWGKAGGPGPCQSAVAEKMKRYVREQRRAGKELLFVATVGDNFFWGGVGEDSWRRQWAEPYGANDPGSPLHGVPWLAVLGDHDYGDSDPYALCPGARPLRVIGGQPYAGRQLNGDRNPSRPAYTERFWLPDYNYHYSIPEADLEVIALDTNAEALGELGGGRAGRAEAFRLCGGRGHVAAFLRLVREAGRELLVQRARNGTARTVVILQHYPGHCQREAFEAALPPGRRVRVLCAYGHVHEQRCDGWDAGGSCDTVLAGGGGGCCPPEASDKVSVGGFAAVRLTDDGGFHTEVESEAVRLPPGTCVW